jgi:hypothetical protein
MAFAAQQITATGSTPVPLLVQGSSGTDFTNIGPGTVTQPLPIQFMVTTGTVYWGGPNVDATHGSLMVASSPVIINSIGNDLPYVWSAGSVTVYVVVGQQ